MIKRIVCRVLGHIPGYRCDMPAKSVWIDDWALAAMRDETANPHDRRPVPSGEIGHFFSYPTSASAAAANSR